MYSESDLDNAVEAGVLPQAAVMAFRDHVARQRSAPVVDEEHFRLLTGFNDIFVSIALVLVLVAIGQVGNAIMPALAGLGIAGASWFLAEYFTRQRRMALPSILLLLGFTGGVAGTLVGLLVGINPNLPDRVDAILGAAIALVTAGAAWLHWRRFMVPITVAAGAVALVGTVISVAFAMFPDLDDRAWPIVLAGGLALFVLAMRWDMSDRERRTRRSDVAFWLHLAAAPMIAHPIFQMLGVFDGLVAAPTAAIVFALYILFAIVALAIDRRALLVSSLAYVLYALYALFTQAGAIELGAAFTALVIGSALLTLSAFWQPMRRLVVTRLGSIRDRLPPVQTAVAA